MGADVDAGMYSTTPGISLVDDMIANHLEAGEKSIPKGMHGDASEHAVVAGLCYDGVVCDDRVPTAKGNDADIRGVYD